MHVDHQLPRSIWNYSNISFKLFGMQRLGRVAAGYGQQRNKQQTLLEHTSALDELKKGLKRDVCNLHMPNVIAQRKSAFATPPPLEECAAIAISELRQGRSDIGAVFWGPADHRCLEDAECTDSVGG